MSAPAILRSKDATVVQGDYAFTTRNFAQIATFLRAQTGIALNEAKAALVYSRLAKRLRVLGLPDFDAYCAHLDKPEGVEERNEMIVALTTNVTRFYREPHHFDYLQREVAPRLVETARRGGRVRLWSAACSSGEEPYSLAMSLLDVFPDAGRFDVRILATDIDSNVVARAREGVYTTDAVSPVPAATRDRWMAREGGQAWRVKDDVKDLIAFRELNLIGTWPMKGQFDVIFCRNVVIYFEEDTQAFLWDRFEKILTREGRLFIGHSDEAGKGSCRR
jgi:chemotaxis protein methyltransferase CheR